jgi:hypothetical protein
MTTNQTSPSTTEEEIKTVASDDPLEETVVRLKWNKRTEKLVSEWGNHAICYNWMHDRAYRKYNNWSYRLMIPIGIFSTITGALNMAMPTLVPADLVETGNKILGGVSIVTGIVTSLQSIFRFAQRSEEHSAAAADWDKLARNIAIELKIDRKSRKEADSFIKVCRSEYDRLMTKTQFIPMDVIMEFNLKFSNHPKLQRPNICDNLEHIEPMQEEETPPATPKENLGVLDQIKEMLAESRLVPVHMKDNEIPARARAHTHHLPTRHSFSIHTNHNEDIPIVPRKMFLGSPPPVKLDLVQELKLAGPSVKDRRKLFEQTQLFKPQVVTTTSPKMQAINEEQSSTVNLPSVEELKMEENNTEQSKVEKIKTSEVILEIHEDNNQQSENNVVSIEIEVPTHQEQISVQRTNQIDEVKEENKAEIKEMEIQKAPIIDINDLM